MVILHVINDYTVTQTLCRTVGNIKYNKLSHNDTDLMQDCKEQGMHSFTMQYPVDGFVTVQYVPWGFEWWPWLTFTLI